MMAMAERPATRDSGLEWELKASSVTRVLNLQVKEACFK